MPKRPVAYQTALDQIAENAALKTESLFLVGLGLTILPPEIGQLSHLKNLWLNDNEIHEIPAEIGQLSRLTYLELNENCLENLPISIAQPTSLTTLDLRGNHLPLSEDIIRQIKRPMLALRAISHNR